MKCKRILLGILLSLIVIPVFIGIGFIRLFLLLIDGIEYVVEGEVVEDDGGW